MLTKLAGPEDWPELARGEEVTPRAIELAIRSLPFRNASEASWKLVGKLGWALLTGIKALDDDITALQQRVKELERENGDLQDAKIIVQEVITNQAEKSQDLTHKTEQLMLRVENK